MARKSLRWPLRNTLSWLHTLKLTALVMFCVLLEGTSNAHDMGRALNKLLLYPGHYFRRIAPFYPFLVRSGPQTTPGPSWILPVPPGNELKLGGHGQTPQRAIKILKFHYGKIVVCRGFIGALLG